MGSYRRLLVFVKPYSWRMVFGLICMIVAAAAYLVVPWLIKNVVDEVLQAKDMMMLNLVVAAILLVFLIRGFATYGQTYTMSYIGQRVIIDIREALFKHLQRLDQAYFDRRKTGVIMSNLTNDVGALQTAIVDNLISFITEGVTLIGSLVSFFILGFVAIPLIIISYVLVSVISNKMTAKA